MKTKLISKWVVAGLILVLSACSTKVPTDFKNNGKEVKIWPDYTQTVIPPNIAPMNFAVNADGDKCVVSIQPEVGNPIVISTGADKDIRIPLKQWKEMLNANKGKTLKYDVYVSLNGQWSHYRPFTNMVAPDSIDPYLTYRLIEPSYMGSGELGLYQYNLETGEETTIFTNHRGHKDPSLRSQKCVNCHSTQPNHPENKLFYYRGPNGGLILTYNGKVQRINTKAGDMYAGTVYPAWHPSLPFIAFSSNVIKQQFMSYDPQKIEQFDLYSDLVLYDIKKNEITAICKTKDKQESTPCWSADGQYLYFASSDSMMAKTGDFKHLLYNIYRMKFNASNKTWGQRELVYDAVSTHHSACFPKMSVDGYLLFVRANYGVAHQTHKSADLYLLNTRTGACRNLVEVNSPTEADSYHDWSGNGRWIVVSSRRQDGNYARPYFAYFDRKGKAYKPFVIPREDPRHDDYLLKNYNVTEFAKAPIVTHQCDIQAVIDAPAKDATYGSPIDKNAIDASSGASTVK